MDMLPSMDDNFTGAISIGQEKFRYIVIAVDQYRKSKAGHVANSKQNPVHFTRYGQAT